jgi:hypothetical protein
MRDYTSDPLKEKIRLQHSSVENMQNQYLCGVWTPDYSSTSILFAGSKLCTSPKCMCLTRIGSIQKDAAEGQKWLNRLKFLQYR